MSIETSYACSPNRVNVYKCNISQTFQGQPVWATAMPSAATYIVRVPSWQVIWSLLDMSAKQCQVLWIQKLATLTDLSISYLVYFKEVCCWTQGKWPTWCTVTLYKMFIIVRVSSNTELIIRRSKCINTASGIVWSLTESTIPDAVLIQFNLLMMSTVLLETCRLRRN